MMQMTGGEAIVRSLAQHGVDTLFGVPGVQMDHLYNALYDARDAIRVIHARHEQGAAYMAYGYAAATGRPGVYAVVPGPGLLNTTAALSTAYACNAPVFCVCGQIPAAAIGRGIGHLHEIPDQLGVIRGLTKWAARADHPCEVPGLMAEAFRHLSTGRVRPVGLEMALDVMALRAAVGIGEAVTEHEPPAPPDPELIDDAARRLGRARDPVIFAGGGIFGAEAELAALAEMLQAPVVMTRNGFGALSDRHYLAHKEAAGHRLWATADVVLGVGTRLHPMFPGWGIDDALDVIRIDVDPREANRVAARAVGIVSDARAGLAALVARVGRYNRTRPSRKTELEAFKARMQAEYEQFGPQMEFLRAIRAELPDAGIFVEELTQPGYVARFGLPIYEPRTFISTGYQGTLGFGFATALGVKVARPDTPVLAIAGDGGFMYNVQELATAVQQEINVVTVIFNDGAFGNVKRMQVEDHAGRVIATELRNPDFVRLAESFGAQGMRADSAAALRAAIRIGFDTPGPTVIDVPVGEMPGPWRFILLGRAR